MNRAPISACLCLCLMSGVATSAIAQASSSHRPGRETVRAAILVDQTRLPYEATIEPTALKAGSTSIATGADQWTARGYDLKTLIAQIFDMDARRVELSDDDLADGRYDLTLSLPTAVDQETMQQVLVDALKRKFGLTIAPETRSMDVYVMSAPKGPTAELHRHIFPGRVASLVGLTSGDAAGDDEGRITFMGQDCSGVVSSNGITVLASSLADFRRTLEPDLDRVLLDETNLAGSYDFKIGTYANKDELFKRMHDELGLVVTPAQRKVTVLTVRPAGEQSMRAAL
jgi:uncharacterized protein (TIGR03435 family)